jgi:RimJ/RimL family protein N-acetyltransferase
MTKAYSKEIFNYRSNKIVNQFQGWIPNTIEDVNDFIDNRISTEIDKENTWFQFVILTKADNEIIGDLGIHFISTRDQLAELGITIDQKHQRKGYATETLKGAINFLFKYLGKHRIVCSIDPRNTVSAAVFKRLGFRKEAHFKKSIFLFNEWVDDVIYALLEEDWK